MLNIYLIQPAIEDFYTTNVRNIPYGLLSIGATLAPEHKVQLLDLRHGITHKILIPAELQAVKPYYRHDDASPFSLYKSYQRFGLTIKQIRNDLPIEADVFLVSALFSTYVPETLEIISLIRKKNPDATIISGGSGAIFHPEEFFAAGVDFIINGEGEIAVPHLLTELESDSPDFTSVPNLIWCTNGKIQQTSKVPISNLDTLPFPEYTLPGTPRYLLNGQQHAMLMASRGCSYNCTFCSIHHLFGTQYRLRSVTNVLAEMAEKVSQKFRSFDFEDDHFGGNKEWLKQLLDGIIKNFEKYNLALQAMNGITVNNLDEEILVKMKQAGFSALNLSLVTPEQFSQDALHRPFDTRQFTSIVAAAHRIGLKITAYLIIGLPGDSIENNLRAILFLADLPVLIGPSLFYLVPGTPIFDELQNQGQIPAAVRCYRSSFFPYERADFSRESALTLFRICRIINFLKAIKEYNYQPAKYQIINNTIAMPPGLSGKENRITLGFALLELLKKTGKLYGTSRKQGSSYPLIEEKYTEKLIDQLRKSATVLLDVI
jgi:radical SAM superfamily enzyme YgiQ (UPF0313 family)